MKHLKKKKKKATAFFFPSAMLNIFSISNYAELMIPLTATKLLITSQKNDYLKSKKNDYLALIFKN